VSTREQDLAAQDAELRNAGCVKTFKEKVSGAKTDRPELAKVIRRLEPDDVLVVTRLDRLARSTRDLLNILGAIAERGAGFKSLKERHHDSTRPADGGGDRRPRYPERTVKRPDQAAP
jgi:DNA invertase Pin-like site-specific DNA recombinase